MKYRLLARFLAITAIVLLLAAGCAPIPANLPRALTPTTSIFVPGVESGGSVNTSPLVPTVAVASTVPVAPASESTATVVVPNTHPTATPIGVGAVWEWVSSAFADGTVLAAGDPARYTFQLLGDGNALVQADCNFGTGSYEIEGGNLSFGAIGTTKMACPPDSLDSAFLAQLQNTAAFAFEAGELVLSLKDDAGTMTLRAAPDAATPTQAPPTEAPTRVSTAIPAPLPTHTPTPAAPTAAPTVFVSATRLQALTGSGWFLVSLTANNQAIPPVGKTPVTLEIDSAGSQMRGSTGCNEYRTALIADAVSLSVSRPALTTQKACAANLMVQEVEFIDSLLRARSYVVRGAELTMYDAAGNALLVFMKK